MYRYCSLYRHNRSHSSCRRCPCWSCCNASQAARIEADRCASRDRLLLANAETLRLRAKRAPCSCLQVAGHFNLGAQGVEHIASGVADCSTMRSLTLERKCHCTRVLQYMNQSTQFNSLIGTTTWHVTECNFPSPALRHLALCTQLEKLLLNSTYYCAHSTESTPTLWQHVGDRAGTCTGVTPRLHTHHVGRARRKQDSWRRYERRQRLESID